jgi:hypothetical protein
MIRHAHSRPTPLRFVAALALAVPLLLLVTACDSGGSDDPPDPVLEMSSIEVGLQGGGVGLQFFVQADMDLNYRKVTVEPPPPFNDDIVYNFGDTFVIAEQSTPLQADDEAYTKVNGVWGFTFDVTSGSGSDTRQHIIGTSITVGGGQSAAADAGGMRKVDPRLP